MKTLFAIVVIVLMSVNAFAEPVLTSDPQAGVTKYRVRLGPTATWLETASVSTAAWFPLNTWPSGNYPDCEMQAGGNISITDKATNVQTTVFEWSNSAFFDYTRTAGNTPKNVRAIDN